MEKVVSVDIQNINEWVHEYDETRVKGSVIKYLVNELGYVKRSDNIKVNINVKVKSKLDFENMLKSELENEYKKSYDKNTLVNYKQLSLLVVGIVFLFLSRLVSGEFIWSEILLITGWVPIWEVINLELFEDTSRRKREKVLKALLNSEISVSYAFK